MSEVSCRVFEFFEEQSEIHGFPLEALLVDTRLPLSVLQDRSEWVLWDDWAAISDRLEALIGPDAIREAGARIPQHGYSRPMIALGSALVRPVQLYEAVVRWLAPLLFRVLEFSVDVRSEVEVEVRIRIPEPHRPCACWMRMAEGSFRTLPSQLSPGSEAVVRAQILE